MKSKTLIEKQIQKKTNPEVVKTIISAKKNNSWVEVASILSRPRRLKINKNLTEISSESKDGETVVVPGKVLSLGELNKKIKIIALSFSDKAKQKIVQAKGEFSNIAEEIKKNPQAKGIKILK